MVIKLGFQWGPCISGTWFTFPIKASLIRILIGIPGTVASNQSFGSAPWTTIPEFDTQGAFVKSSTSAENGLWLMISL